MNTSKNQRMTRQRSVILEELRNRPCHPSAEELFSAVKERVPRVSLGTIYRNLDMLVQTGEVRKLEIPGTCARYDGDLRPHLHAYCRKCGTVADVFTELPTLSELLPDNPAAEARKFEVTGYRLEFEGLCASCQAES